MSTPPKACPECGAKVLTHGPHLHCQDCDWTLQFGAAKPPSTAEAIDIARWDDGRKLTDVEVLAARTYCGLDSNCLPEHLSGDAIDNATIIIARALTAHAEEAVKVATACDACGGTGKALSGECGCGGTGSVWEMLTHHRRLLFDAGLEIAQLRAALRKPTESK